MHWVFRENSLDAIRLIAATQVAILHTCEFMFVERTGSLFFEIMRLFPGVPVFFFVSGYLISKSYENTPAVVEYAKNRVLRLYPALVVCVAVNLLMVWSTGYLDRVNANALDIGLLYLAKSTFLQFYNPDFMRSFGDGVLNGSLWTICVEIQFYILTPILYKTFGKQKQLTNTSLFALIIVFLLANRMLYLWRDDYSDLLIWKLYRVSFAPWIYMFLAGILFQRNFAMLESWLRKLPALPMLITYIAIGLIFTQYLGIKTENEISPILFVLVICVIFRLCYYMPNRVNALMQGNDISYGIYIWHMPIVNQMLYFNYNTSYWHAFTAIAITVVIATISWKFIEKPALKLKHFTLNTRLKASAS